MSTRTTATRAPLSPRPAPSRTSAPGGGLLVVPRRSLVVLAGLPGAGKTTLLRRLDADRTPGVLPLDSEEVAGWLGAHGRRLPYRFVRPAVHGLHLLRVAREVHGPAACVLTTDPMPSPLRRLLLRVAACSSGRSLSVVLVVASEEQARSGQRSRGRALGERRMTRHLARHRRLLARLERTGQVPRLSRSRSASRWSGGTSRRACR